mgnify:FL=1|jgi:glycosyltransferase involved in cell wall biosynthesis
MNIVHYFPTTRLSEGGTVRAAIDFCAVLARRGNSITWLTCDDEDVPESWKKKAPNTPDVVLLGKLENARGRLTKQQIAKATEVVQAADVVHIHAMWTPSNPQVAKACTVTGTPWVLSIHGMLDDWCMEQRGLKKRFYLSTMGRIMPRGAAIFHATAEEEKRQASRWLKHSNISVIPCIVDLEPYKELPEAQEAVDFYGECDSPTVLFLSRVHEKKSIETLIDAAKLLKERGQPIRLFIAGGGEESYIKTLKARANAAGIADQVQFLGIVSGTLKYSLFAMADVFALPTQQENFGLVYPESMLCGTPVIGTKGTDIWRELEEGGAVIAARTPEAFADAIQSMCNDKPLLEKLSAKGRAHMLAWLNTDSVGMQYEEMYCKAVNEQ